MGFSKKVSSFRIKFRSFIVDKNIMNKKINKAPRTIERIPFWRIKKKSSKYEYISILAAS